jgi:hypothetical protein
VSARWTTPRLLRGLLGAILVLAALLAFAGYRAVVRAREAMQAVARDTAPAILAAQEVSAALADLDANEANYLLASDAVARDQAAQLVEYRRAEATKRLVEAAHGTALSDDARAAIVLVLQNLGRYEEASSRARQAADRGDPQAALDAYRVATDILHGRMLVDAQRLDDINHDAMERTFADQERTSGVMETLALLCGVVLVLVLVLAQAFLVVRARRLVNPALAAATIIALLYTGDLQQRIGDAREDVRVAKQDCFDSMRALWQARAHAYDASGDVSRFLLDRPHEDSWEASFKTSVAGLTSDPSYRPRDNATGRVALTGAFGTELNNITFVGEREAATAMVVAFGDYYVASDKVRTLERAGNHADAMAAVPAANAAFIRFDSAVLRTLDVNQYVFDSVVGDGEHALSSAAWIHPLLAALVALGAFLGLRPRLREYSS